MGWNISPVICGTCGYPLIVWTRSAAYNLITDEEKAADDAKTADRTCQICARDATIAELQARLKNVVQVPILPVSEEDEAVIDRLMARVGIAKRATG